MSRVAIAISCTAKDRHELERLSKCRTDEARLVERAKIMLSCLDGKRNDETAAELGVHPGTVSLWRGRFAAQGLSGLRDRKRSGKPPKYPASDLRQRILNQLEKTPPAGLATWDGAHWPKRWMCPMTQSGAYCANQIEIWFGILGRKTLSGASFASTEQLTQAIDAFITIHNQKATPFVWRKREVRGAQLRNTIVNLCN